MRTRQRNTRFMNANIDLEYIIYDLLIDKYGYDNVSELGICFDDCLFSNGFINAIERGLTPECKIDINCKKNYSKEYHHLIFNDECYVMYFN